MLFLQVEPTYVQQISQKIHNHAASGISNLLTKNICTLFWIQFLYPSCLSLCISLLLPLFFLLATFHFLPLSFSASDPPSSFSFIFLCPCRPIPFIYIPSPFICFVHFLVPIVPCTKMTPVRLRAWNDSHRFSIPFGAPLGPNESPIQLLPTSMMIPYEHSH